jgi:uncharacterized phiE125 gp8 family phage protein
VFDLSMLDLTLTTTPEDEPISTAEAKKHLRVVDTAEDDLIDGLVAAARLFVEGEIGRALVSQGYDLRLPRWPSMVLLPRSPVTAIDGVSYFDAAGVEHELDSDAYVLCAGFDPARLLFDSRLLPTDTLGDVQPVLISYTAGYGDPADVPQTIKQAMQLLVAHWYLNREAVVATGARNTLSEVPLAVMALLAPYRLQWFGSWWQ